VSGRLILIGGGARSGKSAFALRLARRLGEQRVFVATAEGLDEEMRDRIARHREERGSDFEAIEEPVDIVAALGRSEAPVVVIDCLTLWLSNLLCRDATDAAVSAELDRLTSRVSERDRTYVLVTNEVGLGLVPENPLGRRFRDHSGRMNQRLAAASDEVYFGLMGTILQVKPTLAPVFDVA
jgi:adenosylcobinamide kinase/adenosylcobinamide-phosphate guanylyltransferase